jgi:hypothetical protein
LRQRLHDGFTRHRRAAQLVRSLRKRIGNSLGPRVRPCLRGYRQGFGGLLSIALAQVRPGKLPRHRIGSRCIARRGQRLDRLWRAFGQAERIGAQPVPERTAPWITFSPHSESLRTAAWFTERVPQGLGGDAERYASGRFPEGIAQGGERLVTLACRASGLSPSERHEHPRLT